MTQEDWFFIEACRTKWRTDDPEEHYWVFTDCQEQGWRAEIMLSHHDGDLVAGYSSNVLKPGAASVTSLIEAARAAYVDAFPGEG